ncbi:MAG: tRNA pseudouridine(38-40) synthase TruA [Lachnospiraceae bacterium]|nr:tRNA pseudouridine(38-40) synthase TruA [Lachnospiraceae bacterium]
MKRIMLTVAYDGTNYCGWQIQPTGLTVEEVLNRELSRLLGEDIRVLGVSRTDSGVHALGNLCVFDTETSIPAEKICYAINQSLPPDIVVQSSCEVPSDFHPRKHDSIKTYEYVIYAARIPSPIRDRYCLFFYQPLDVEKMRRAAACLIGEHDFKSFCSSHSDKEYTVRTLTDITIETRRVSDGNALDGEAPAIPGSAGLAPAEEIRIRVSGTGFLYNMVRIIVGTLLRVGTGFWPPEYVSEILESKDRGKAGPCAPARGLTLLEIKLL